MVLFVVQVSRFPILYPPTPNSNLRDVRRKIEYARIKCAPEPHFQKLIEADDTVLRCSKIVPERSTIARLDSIYGDVYVDIRLTY